MNTYTSFICQVCFLCSLRKIASQTNYAIIDEDNCVYSTRTINVINSTIQFIVKISPSIVSKKCLVYVTNEDFQGSKLYTVTMETNGAIYVSANFNVSAYTGHPSKNIPLQTLNRFARKWTGHLPSWDMYLSIVGYAILDLSITLTIAECNKNCFQMNTPGIIPTNMLSVPAQCDYNYCLDNYSMIYNIRTYFMLPTTCSLYFTLKNEPSICIAIGEYWTDTLINSTKCRTTKIKLDYEVFVTFDRLISKPWCLPWKTQAKTLTITWEDVIGGPGQSLCTMILYTNSSGLGNGCDVTKQTLTSQTSTKDDVAMTVGIIVSSVGIILVAVGLVVYVVIKKRQVPAVPIAANFHNHSSVQIISPPPYSIAIQDQDPALPYGIWHIGEHVTYFEETSEETRSSNADESTDSGVSSLTENCRCNTLEPPPPYSET